MGHPHRDRAARDPRSGRCRERLAEIGDAGPSNEARVVPALREEGMKLSRDMLPASKGAGT